MHYSTECRKSRYDVTIDLEVRRIFGTHQKPRIEITVRDTVRKYCAANLDVLRSHDLDLQTIYLFAKAMSVHEV